MAQLAGKLSTLRREQREREEERQALIASLTHTRTLINQAYGCFNATNDESLIDSYIFEISALHCRYDYLLRRVKELEAAT